MSKLSSFWTKNIYFIAFAVSAALVLGGLLLYKLGSLTGGLSSNEMASASNAVGWHGIYHQPLDMPLKLLRSIVFYIQPEHGQLLTRLPNAVFGGLTILSFGWLVYLWHGRRTAIFAGLLFATSAWTLHTSRLASFEIMNMWGIVTLLLVQVLLYKYGNNFLIWVASLFAWGALLYLPGFVWLIILQLLLQRALIKRCWQLFSSIKQRFLAVLAVFIWLPLLLVDLFRPGQLREWAGLPAHLADPAHLLKQLGGVFVHLFIRGPQYPEQWLARSPVLDILTLLAFGLGSYFYLTRYKASRSRMIAIFFAVGIALVALGGPVGLSLLVPLLYVIAAAGIAYLLHDWLKVFPLNPFARGLGIGLVAVVIGLSCIYNLRAYFVAWPHHSATQAVFRYHR